MWMNKHDWPLICSLHPLYAKLTHYKKQSLSWQINNHIKHFPSFMEWIIITRSASDPALSQINVVQKKCRLKMWNAQYGTHVVFSVQQHSIMIVCISLFSSCMLHHFAFIFLFIHVQTLQFNIFRNPDFREVILEQDGRILLRFAIANGFRNIQNLVQKMKRGKSSYHYVEVMACPSGTHFPLDISHVQIIILFVMVAQKFSAYR